MSVSMATLANQMVDDLNRFIDSVDKVIEEIHSLYELIEKQKQEN